MKGQNTVLHLGLIYVRDAGYSPIGLHEVKLPPGFLTDGDSFLVWGEHPYEDEGDDGTLHVLAPGYLTVPEARGLLAMAVGDDYLDYIRLFDYVVRTDWADWGECQVTTMYDGTSARSHQAVDDVPDAYDAVWKELDQ